MPRCFPRFRARRLKTSVMTEAGRWDDTDRRAFFLPAGGGASVAARVLQGKTQGRSKILLLLLLRLRRPKGLPFGIQDAPRRNHKCPSPREPATRQPSVRNHGQLHMISSAGIPPGVARRCRGETPTALLSSLPCTSVEDLRDDGSGKVGRYRPSGFFLACGQRFCLRRPKGLPFGIQDAPRLNHKCPSPREPASRQPSVRNHGQLHMLSSACILPGVARRGHSSGRCPALRGETFGALLIRRSATAWARGFRHRRGGTRSA